MLKLIKINSTEAGNIRLMLFGFIMFSFLTIKLYPLDLLKKILPDVFKNESTCIMLNVTGIPCPFCGMSHAFYEFLNLNLLKSIYYNPSSVLFFSFSAVLIFSIFVLSIYNYKIDFHFNRTSLCITGIVLIVMWVLNIYFGHLS